MCDRVVFVLAAWAMVALAGVRPASAQGANVNVYRWINNTNTNLIWNDPANWMRIAWAGHGDPNIPELPNAATDIASFSGTYTSDRGVGLPNVTIVLRGIVVETTEPVMAERAMYFGSVPGRNWSGGHVNIGAPRPSTSWFHAEGATGSFFETFILLSNPQDTPAEVDLQFLLEGGGAPLFDYFRQTLLGRRVMGGHSCAS